MGQIARPASDDFTGGWSPGVDLFKRINGAVANTASPAVSGSNPQGDAAQVKLSGIAWPGGGNRVLTVGLAGDGVTLATVVLTLGGQVIAARTFRPSAGLQNYDLTLSAAQAAQIGNYADLHVEVIAGGVTVSCCPNALPLVLQATITNTTGGFDCLPGAVALTWDGLLAWRSLANQTVCSGTPCEAFGSSGGIWSLECSGGQWILGTSGHGAPTLVSASCSPFQLVFLFASGGPCTGTYTLTITE